MRYFLGPFAEVWDLPSFIIQENWVLTRRIATAIWRTILVVGAVLIGTISIYLAFVPGGITK